MSSFDTSGTISTDDLGAVLRSLGWNLTESQVNSFINEHDNDGSGTIDFSVFHHIVQRNSHEMSGPCSYDAVMKAFDSFDLYKDGTMTAPDFVHMLRGIGEPLTELDVNQLLKEVDIDGNDKINIRNFVEKMFDSSLVQDDDEELLENHLPEQQQLLLHEHEQPLPNDRKESPSNAQ